MRGRVMQVWVADGLVESSLICVHNYGIGNQGMKRVPLSLHDLVAAHEPSLWGGHQLRFVGGWRWQRRASTT